MWMVTGGNGQLGRGIVEHVLRLAPVDRVVVGVRDPAAAQDLASRGVTVRAADFEDARALETAIEGVDRLLIVSTTGMPHTRRLEHHLAAIGAATRAGVGEIVYTSLIETAPDCIGAVHRQTEEALFAAGVRATSLRHPLYLDGYVDSFVGETSIETVYDGPINAALRADLAEAAARVLADPDRRSIYDFTGPSAWRMSDLAAEVAKVSGAPMPFRTIDEAAFLRQLVDEQVPAFLCDILLDIQRVVRDGGFAHVTGELAEVLGRPPVSMADQVAARWGAGGPSLGDGSGGGAGTAAT